MSGDARDERHARGWEALTRVNGTDDPRVVREVAELAPELARWIVEFGYGDAWAREQLGPRERQLATVGALAAQGGCEEQLRVHANVALNVGVTPDELVECMLHLVPYVGFPRALNALGAVRSVLERRGEWTSEEYRGEA